MTNPTRSIRRTTRPGFSLAEVLIALFILGIGLISIAAIFPAGIIQQRRASDELMGPVVAANAMSILRQKFTAADFGTFEEFNFAQPQLVRGDWTWGRPGVITQDVVIDQQFVPAGSVDLFWRGSDPNMLREIPHNSFRYGAWENINRPHIFVTQQERYYPMLDRPLVDNPVFPSDYRPEYVWDFMVRRHEGRILVAIFVYRASLPGGETVQYVAGEALPRFTVFEDAADQWDAPYIGHSDYSPDFTEVPGLDPSGSGINRIVAGDPWFDWQADGQILLDQFDFIHQVARGRRSANDDGVALVKPVRPAPKRPGYNWTPFVQNGFINPNVETVYYENVVNTIWHLPITDVNGIELRPVYVSVEEL
ncbi:MAG: prepilin-type N-terminal cleavage/methylation domain-containing protein [Phycisphaerales bacterium]|nr:prepilin-type N-terminal cleavage/methylation domain-containing protein [Phycisphaerales bacterium]